MNFKFSCTRGLLGLALVFSALTGFPNVKLPQLVSNHMVLQHDIKLKIWGWASPREKVSIWFNGIKRKTVTTADGKWILFLPAMQAGGPYTMTITGNNNITLNDVLIGDVWFCSGQSNMVIPMERVKEKYPDEIANADFPQIRNFFIPAASDVTQVHQDLPPGNWIVASPTAVLGFGAASYFFAKSIYLKYHIPIGIINSSVGGTPIEAWISAEGYAGMTKFEDQIKKFKDTAYMNSLARQRLTVRSNFTDTKMVTEPDKGLSGPEKWTDPAYQPLGWHKFWMPGYWDDQGVKDLNGTVYFRKEIEVPASMAGIPAKLFMGRIIDADSAFINGTFVGNITYQYPPRRYTVPAGVLKAGKNIIVIKVMNTAGKGGFVPDKNYSLVVGGAVIDLRGDWLYKVGQVQPKINFSSSANVLPAPLFISPQDSPTGLYNTMVAPAIDYAVKGFIWYQGEANTGRPKEYAQLLPALIADWRTKWQLVYLPFIYVQLPNFMEVNYSPSESGWAELRESQLKSLSVPNTALVVTIDLGEWNDIHPLDKKDVGNRLSLAAEHLAYGDKQVVCSGPVYQSSKIEGNKIIISFSNTGSGLISNDGNKLYYFSVAGADKNYVWAKATIEGDKLVVWSDAVTKPQYVRYAWADNPEGANLANKEGLPASPFETDTNQ